MYPGKQMYYMYIYLHIIKYNIIQNILYIYTMQLLYNSVL